jgi:hypothetical protein
MTSKPPSRPTFMTPLSRSDLFDPGQVFPRDELLRRVLSHFWRDCCVVPRFSRAPAPVVELSPESGTSGVAGRLRAWWLLCDGIIEECDGPDSERVELFFGGPNQTGQLWPRYEFRVLPEPMSLELMFHLDARTGRGSRVQLSADGHGSVRVTAQEPWFAT